MISDSGAVSGDAVGEAIKGSINRQIQFQHKWHILSMLAYAAVTIGMLILSAAATVLAADGMAKIAAVCSAAATVLIGIEKGFLFREKWKFHLAIQTRLTLLRAKLDLGGVNSEAAYKEFSQVMSAYAAELPMAPKDN